MSAGTRIGRLAIAIAITTLAAPAGAQPPRHTEAELADTGNPKHGFTLFVSDGCAECHGTVGQGGPGLRLAPTPMPASAIAQYIRDPAGEMPPYPAKVVSDADIDDIHAYLASVAKPPPVSAIPELN